MKILKRNLSDEERRLLHRIEKRWDSVNATDSRQQLPSLIDEVRITRTRKVLMRRDMAVGALVSMQDLMRLEALDVEHDQEAVKRLDALDRDRDRMPTVDRVKAARTLRADGEVGREDAAQPEQDVDSAAATQWLARE